MPAADLPSTTPEPTMLADPEGRPTTARPQATTADPLLALRLQRALDGRWTVRRELGGGGMSRLFLAEGRPSGPLGSGTVVVKVVPAPDAGDRRRVLEEARVTAQLRHPHVLPILACGAGEGLAWLVTPYAAGGTLRDRLRDALRDGAPLPVAMVARLLDEVAAALAHAHAHGIVHGDLKPENVLLHEGRALLADFGAARRARPRWAPRSPAGIPSIGTPLYMSPEQAAGDPHLDARADVYSFGVLAFELLTGRPPFVGASPRAVLLAHLGEPAPDLTTLRPDVPAALAAVVARLLAKDPADRPADGAALAAALGAPLAAPLAAPLVVRPRRSRIAMAECTTATVGRQTTERRSPTRRTAAWLAPLATATGAAAASVLAAAAAMLTMVRPPAEAPAHARPAAVVALAPVAVHAPVVTPAPTGAPRPIVVTIATTRATSPAQAAHAAPVIVAVVEQAFARQAGPSEAAPDDATTHDGPPSDGVMRLPAVSIIAAALPQHVAEIVTVPVVTSLPTDGCNASAPTVRFHRPIAALRRSRSA